MLSMWKKKLDIHNKGSFTIEAVFVMLIIVGVVMTMLYVTMYCCDKVTMECRVREYLKGENREKNFKGQLGQGVLEKTEKTERLKYHIKVKYPLTERYLENGFTTFKIEVRRYGKNVCDFVRKYDAVRSKE